MMLENGVEDLATKYWLYKICLIKLSTAAAHRQIVLRPGGVNFMFCYLLVKKTTLRPEMKVI